MSKNHVSANRRNTDGKYTFKEVPLVYSIKESQINFSKQRRRHNIANFIDYFLKKFGL